MSEALIDKIKSTLSPIHAEFTKIGFIGQGFIGKNYADDFERRGYAVVRYALEEPYRANQEKIKECKIVFIAVPTPTTPHGFDDSVVRSALALVPDNAIAVIKSTIIPGSTLRYQQAFPKLTVLYSPEFLSEATAAHDAAHPFSNIVGIPVNDELRRLAGETVLALLPPAPFAHLCSSTEAELIKYSHNLSGYVQIVLFNVLYDTAQSLGAQWEPIHQALRADPFISSRYSQPLHKSGRGAGGHCFIKDFAAFRELYSTLRPADTLGLEALVALEHKNIELLRSTHKDTDLLQGVYGQRALLVRGGSFMSRLQIVFTIAGSLVILAGFLDILTRFVEVLLR